MRTLLCCLILACIALPARAQEHPDLQSLAGDWTYAYMAGGIHVASLTLVWDGADLRGQTTYTDYNGKTAHDDFTHAEIRDGKLVFDVNEGGNPAGLKGELSPDGSFIRGDYHAPMTNGVFLLNRVIPGAPPGITGDWILTMQAFGGTPITGRLRVLADNGGSLNGWLRLPDREYHFEVKGTVSPQGSVHFSGWSQGQDLVFDTAVNPDGSVSEGQWSQPKLSGVFTMTRR